MSSKQVPSPEATGGAGVSFEMRVGAIALTRLLRGDRVVGLDNPPMRVQFQQRVASAVLDDIVLEAADPRGGSQVLECQVKRTMSITAGDEDFCDVVGRVVRELETDPALIEGGRRRFCIATRPTMALGQLDRVLRSARAHDTPAGFLEVLASSGAKGVRERLNALRSVVTAALSDGVADAEVDTATWRVARVLYVWPIDAEPESDDVRRALDRLTDLLRDGAAQVVFSELLALAQELAPHAGSTDLAMLRTRLEAKGIALDDSPSRRAAFERLAANSQSLLDPGAAKLGRRLHLPRPALRRAVRSAIEEHDIVLLKGRAGVGKSIAARLVGIDLAGDGAEVIVVNVSGRSGPLALLEQDLGGSLADALAGAPIGGQRLLIIDGAEQALTDGGQLLTGLLAAVPVEKGSAPPWRVLLTSRDEAASAATRIVTDRTGSAPGVVSVEELEDGEVDLIVEAFPRLVPVHRNARARSLLLRRPYLVELLVRAVETHGLPSDIAGEEDVLAIVNDRLVRRDQGGLPGRGAPYARADIFLQLGEAVVDNALPVRLDGTDPEARAGLSSDDIIAELRSSWRFAHDVMADYAAATRLLVSDGSARLRGASMPRRLLRAVRLRLQREFADALAAGKFAEVWHVANSDAEELAALDGPRWRDVPWEALLHLGRTRDALDELRPELLANDGAQLLRLVDVAHRLARRTNTGEADELTLLDTTLTGPVVDLLATNALAIPLRTTVASGRLVRDHLYAAAHRNSDAELHHQTDLADAVVHWAQDDEWGPRFEHAVGALALNAANLESRHEAFLIAHAKERPAGVAEAVEAPVTSQQLASTRPDLLLRLAGLYYLGRTLPMTGEAEESGKRPDRHAFGFDDEEGIRDHSLDYRNHLSMWPLGNNQSNPALGPFASLLNVSVAHGLRLVGEIVDEATAARTQLEGGFGTGDRSSVEVELSCPEWPEPRRYVGPATVWMWHRRTGVGPGPALSALMALREWAIAQIKAGESPEAIRDAVLSTGTSLAFVSVALSVLVDRIDEVTDELDMFLPHALLWHLETARVTHEHGTALEIPEAKRLSWDLSSVAILLVLRGDADRRERLRVLGAELVANSGELTGADSEFLARRWAAELDVDRFVLDPRDEGVAINVTYPEGVIEELQQRGGAAAVVSLRLAGLMFKAIQIRDGNGDLAEAATVWAEVLKGCDELTTADDAYSVYEPVDILSAAGSAIVMAADAGSEVEDAQLFRAVDLLLEGATHFGQAAPPGTVDLSDGDERRSQVADMVYDMGADRSIAMALPALLFDAHLRARAGVSLDIVGNALVALTATPHRESRSRLVTRVRRAWDLPCGGDAHQIALRVARQLLATEGLVRRTDRYGLVPVMMAEPLDATIRSSSDMSFDVASASFGADLANAARCDCTFGHEARLLVDALIDYDQRVWPDKYARRHYHRTSLWRHVIDGAVADRVMAGDDSALDSHLDAFAPVGEELHSFLDALVARAVDAASAARLHAIWPRILDRLLPTARSLERGRDTRDRRPYHGDIERLDCALVLVPSDVADWPNEDTFKLGTRWLVAYKATPHVADRAIVFVGKLIGLGNDVAIQLVLSVLGDDIERIRRSSHLVTVWLQLVLKAVPAGDASTRARNLLDRLAAAGDEGALRAQLELEA